MTERPPTEHHLSIVTELADARARKATAPAVHEDLRAWAKGIHTSGAAVELLIRGFGGRFAAPGNPWIQPREHIGHWADLEAIPGNIRALSSGERAYLLITASIGLFTYGSGNQVHDLGRDSCRGSDTGPQLARLQLIKQDNSWKVKAFD